MTTMHMLETVEADIADDVHGPPPTADGRPPLFMIGQPMDAGGFGTLAACTVVQDRWVSFMWSFHNLISVDQATVLEIARRVERFTFDRVYGSWWGRRR